MTKVTLSIFSRHSYLVETDRLGYIGQIVQWGAGPWKFNYSGDLWTKLTYDENTEVLAAALKKVTVLNIARVLTQ